MTSEHGDKPTLFSLMTRLTAEERQRLAERRRALLASGDLEERLVKTGEGIWSLEYWNRDGKAHEMRIAHT